MNDFVRISRNAKHDLSTEVCGSLNTRSRVDGRSAISASSSSRKTRQAAQHLRPALSLITFYSVILVHGISMVVTVILEVIAKMQLVSTLKLTDACKTAVQLGKQFSVILTQPDDQGNESQDRMIRRLLELSVSVTVVPDRAVAFVMGRVDFVMTGASGVVENGGIINIIGTLNVALIAKALNRPVSQYPSNTHLR